MKEIKLTQGKIALVSDIDFEYLNQYKWFTIKHRNTHYAGRNVLVDGKQKMIRMHREILQIVDSNILCDHIDRNGLNNQRDNLRICTNQENIRNTKKYDNSSSNYKGVHVKTTVKKNGKKYKYYYAQIKLADKKKYLGYFPFTVEGEIQAALAYNKAAIKNFGEFASVNKIQEATEEALLYMLKNLIIQNNGLMNGLTKT